MNQRSSLLLSQLISWLRGSSEVKINISWFLFSKNKFFHVLPDCVFSLLLFHFFSLHARWKNERRMLFLLYSACGLFLKLKRVKICVKKKNDMIATVFLSDNEKSDVGWLKSVEASRFGKKTIWPCHGFDGLLDNWLQTKS